MSINRWLIYQKERFPLVMYSVLSGAFTYSGLCLSLLLRNAPGFPDWQSVLVAFVVTLLVFAQLRIADEFKDHQEDCRYQPYRPVPRGLVTLRELGLIGIACAAIQLVLTVALKPQLLIFLLMTWTYLGLMTKEFFVRDWLRRRPLFYMFSHMTILVFIDVYITACDWFVANQQPPPGLVLFLCVSFFNGLVIELGRKLRAPGDEEHGVETYTSLWGLGPAAFAWLASIACSALFVALTAVRVADVGAAASSLFVMPSFILLCLMFAGALAVGLMFWLKPASSRAHRLELFSALWIVSMYISLGTLPAILRSL